MPKYLQFICSSVVIAGMIIIIPFIVNSLGQLYIIQKIKENSSYRVPSDSFQENDEDASKSLIRDVSILPSCTSILTKLSLVYYFGTNVPRRMKSGNGDKWLIGEKDEALEELSRLKIRIMKYALSTCQDEFKKFQKDLPSLPLNPHISIFGHADKRPYRGSPYANYQLSRVRSYYLKGMINEIFKQEDGLNLDEVYVETDWFENDLFFPDSIKKASINTLLTSALPPNSERQTESEKGVELLIDRRMQLAISMNHVLSHVNYDGILKGFKYIYMERSGNHFNKKTENYKHSEGFFIDTNIYDEINKSYTSVEAYIKSKFSSGNLIPIDIGSQLAQNITNRSTLLKSIKNKVVNLADNKLRFYASEIGNSWKLDSKLGYNVVDIFDLTCNDGSKLTTEIALTDGYSIPNTISDCEEGKGVWKCYRAEPFVPTIITCYSLKKCKKDSQACKDLFKCICQNY
jgi:hypothetical protein